METFFPLCNCKANVNIYTFKSIVSKAQRTSPGLEAAVFHHLSLCCPLLLLFPRVQEVHVLVSAIPLAVFKKNPPAVNEGIESLEG